MGPGGEPGRRFVSAPRWRPRLVFPLLALLSACSSTPPEGPVVGVATPGVVAFCAGKPIQASQVAAVAARQKISPREALEGLAEDARAAAAAEKIGLDRSTQIQGAQRAILARALLSELRRESAAEPTAAEIASLRAERWLDFDRPAGVRMVHAVAIVAGEAPPETEALAKKIASAVHEATLGAHDEASFKEKAGTVAHEGIDLRIESLPPVARDGRVLAPEAARFDDAFVSAAFQLEKAGSLSGVVHSPFGYHVMLLLEQLPAVHFSDEELRQLAREELAARRGNVLLKSLLEARKKEVEVGVSRSAAEALSGLDSRQAPR